MSCDPLPAGLQLEPVGILDGAVRDGHRGSVDASPSSGADWHPRERPIALRGA